MTEAYVEQKGRAHSLQERTTHPYFRVFQINTLIFVTSFIEKSLPCARVGLEYELLFEIKKSVR